MDTPANKKFLGRSVSEWLSSLPIFSLLLLTLVIGTGEMFHGQLLRMGEQLFGDKEAGVQYFLMRADPEKPDCDVNMDVEAEVQKQSAPGASAGGDDIDSLFSDEPVDTGALRESLTKAKQLCVEKQALYVKIKEHITPQVTAYRNFETAFFGIFRFGTENRALLLLLMVAIASITTTLGLHHIALRPPKTRLDFRVYSVAMTLANSVLTFSSAFYLNSQLNSGIPLEKPYLYWLWIGMFGALTLISAKGLLKAPAGAEPGGKLSMALLSLPLYSVMALIAGGNFMMQGHFAGLAIYLGQMMELAGTFLSLALYIWAGMLLKQTRVVDLFLDILRPWKLSPEFLTYIILVAAAVPTAYTGASGIFVIAAGAVIYREVQAAGARRQFALAATSMSGSLGVVLAPCLLVVVIAALNKEVTTSLLYGYGTWVFLLSSTMFLIASQVLRREKIHIARPSDALHQSLKAFVPVAPYVVIVFLVAWGMYGKLLNTKMDEFNASTILPVILLMILAFDKLRRDPKHEQVPEELRERRVGLEESVRTATNDTIGHIGALILLMALSVSMGGVIERSGIMQSVPETFGSIWPALILLVGLLVFVGMVMDPFGAVILTSATIAPIAYKNGINPVHFWMIVLTAFELGYLTPPVALNQLLTRQVVGEKEIADADAEVRHLSFYWRYERWILPCIIMGITLLLVAFVPPLLKDSYAKMSKCHPEYVVIMKCTE